MTCTTACEWRQLDVRPVLWALSLAVAIAAPGCTESDDSSTTAGASEVDDSVAPTATQTAAATSKNDQTQTEPDDSIESLTRHATRLWDARVAEDWPTVFEYQQFRSEDELTVEEFANWSRENEPFIIRSYDIEHVAVEDDLGWVTLEYKSSMRQFPDAPAKTTSRQEKWQRLDGRWLLVPPLEYDLYPVSPAERDLVAENDLLDRFEESWQARVDADWSKLYAMSDPKDHDYIAEHELAEAKSLTIYLQHDVEWVQVIGDNGVVRVAITHKINDPNLTKLPERVVVKNEHWIRRDGQWYMDLRPEGVN